MPSFEIIALLLIGALVWFWLAALKARELAVRAASTACKAEDLQLLDETVAVVSLKPARDAEGHLVWRRVYAFEYSDTGDNRRPGSVVLLGNRVLVVNVGLRLVSGARSWH
jgi:hypothetical protein